MRRPRYRPHRRLRLAHARAASPEVYRAVWSPQLLLTERRRNVNHLIDSTLSLQERCATFEGAEGLSELGASAGLPSPCRALPTTPLTSPPYPAEPVRSSLVVRQLQAACDGVARHIARASDGTLRLSRMVLHFKFDPRGRLWLLWCSSARTTAPLEAEAGIRRAIAPANARLRKYTAARTAAHLERADGEQSVPVQEQAEAWLKVRHQPPASLAHLTRAMHRPPTGTPSV